MRAGTLHGSDCDCWSPSLPAWFDPPPGPRAWVDSANCRGKADLFFVDLRGQPEDRARKIAPAKALCSTCPVRPQCLEEVLALAASDDSYGFVAGLTVDQRRRLRAEHPPPLRASRSRQRVRRSPATDAHLQVR